MKKTVMIVFSMIVFSQLFACVSSSSDVTFEYDGDKNLSEKKLEKKYRRDEGFCSVEADKPASSHYGAMLNLRYGEELDRAFIQCMMTRDWVLVKGGV